MTPLQLESVSDLFPKVINLVGGLLLLTAGYYALLSRRARDAERRAGYRRVVLRISTGFLMFAYASAVLAPEVTAWPTEFGWTLREYFQQLDTVPETINGELTAFYTALTDKVGVVTGPETVEPDPLAFLLEPIRTLGLVVYTLAFSAASLGLRVPKRVLTVFRGGDETE